jgi:hypothetical protein
MKIKCLVLALLASILLAENVMAQFVDGEFFFDSFDDGDHQDSDPAYWKRGTFHAIDDVVVDGDFQIQGRYGDASVAPSQSGGAYWSYEDVSLTTQLRILNPDGVTDAYVGVYGRSLSPAVYFGMIRETGLISIGETNSSGNVSAIEQFQTDLDPVAHDVLLRMDFVGDLMSLTVWDPDLPMPSTPQLTYRDSSFSSGTIGLGGGGSGDAVYRWADVAMPPPGCDLNNDLWCDTMDIDLLMNVIGDATNDLAFDLNGDAAVDDTDRDRWLASAATHNGLSTPFLLGDANLDLRVDAGDLNALGIAWQSDNHSWSSGNFSGTGVNATDLNLLGVNWQRVHPDAAAVAAVPEPSNAMLYLLGLLGIVAARCKMFGGNITRALLQRT